MTEGDQQLLSSDDDNFHDLGTDAWWSHETSWFWFSIPERGIGGWIYNWIRPNIGVSGGGCWIWDGSTFLHWEIPYFSNYHNLRLPSERDLRDFIFPSGVRVQALVPLSKYRLSYSDHPEVEFDFTFEAVMDPWVSVDIAESGMRHPYHFDQFGRVTGTLLLHGEKISVNCLAIRDRTWGVRSERWTRGGGYGYTSAMSEFGQAFLSIGDSSAMKGFVVIDGLRTAVVSGTRKVIRNPVHGWPIEVALEMCDDQGRVVEAIGTSISRVATPVPGVNGVVWTSLVDWRINGVQAWGDDQEPWPIKAWAALRRENILLRDGPKKSG